MFRSIIKFKIYLWNVVEALFSLTSSLCFVSFCYYLTTRQNQTLMWAVSDIPGGGKSNKSCPGTKGKYISYHLGYKVQWWHYTYAHTYIHIFSYIFILFFTSDWLAILFQTLSMGAKKYYFQNMSNLWTFYY